MMDQAKKRTPYRVLIADDVLETRRNTRLMLADNPMVDIVAIAHNGREAVEMCAQNPDLDLVLMDISLNGSMDGVEAAALIRERFDIPVIYLTAHADEPTLQRAKLTDVHAAGDCINGGLSFGNVGI